ncbi:MAG: hypothetical protein KC766_12660 [Myxococcales bacterium]|nr:hypothetical protein [Myxococcales bacterium]
MSRAVLRLLEVVRAQLGAADARLEIGGLDPDDPHLVWVNLEDSERVVVVFEDPPEDREAQRERLVALLNTFAETLSGVEPGEAMQRHAPPDRRLEQVLDALRSRCGASLALIVDEQSPMLWSRSGLGSGFDRDLLLDVLATSRACQELGLLFGELVRLEPEELQVQIQAALKQGSASRHRQRELVTRIERARGEIDVEQVDRALAAAALVELVTQQQRGSDRFAVEAPGRVHVGRRITGIYWVALTVEASWSELQTEAALRDLLPGIERLVLALPPFDPPPRGARVLRLPSPLRSV